MAKRDSHDYSKPTRGGKSGGGHNKCAGHSKCSTMMKVRKKGGKMPKEKGPAGMKEQFE